MAALRNLQNLDEAGLSDEDVAPIIARFSDPEQVRRSRQFPFRFLSAYLNVPSLRWGQALETALDAATADIPELPGRTLILIDTSASMGQQLSRNSAMTMVQAAALFGLATGIRNRDRADLYGFADRQFLVERSAYLLSILKATEAFTRPTCPRARRSTASTSPATGTRPCPRGTGTVTSSAGSPTRPSR